MLPLVLPFNLFDKFPFGFGPDYSKTALGNYSNILNVSCPCN